MKERARVASSHPVRRALRCAFVLALVWSAGHPFLAAQTRQEEIGSLGQLFGGFFTKSSYVGSIPVSLARFDDHRARIKLHGFSIAPPADPNWFLAYSSYSSATIVQTVWFVKDPHLYSIFASGKKIEAEPSSLIARMDFYGNDGTEDFTTRVTRRKAADWAESDQVLALNVQPLSLGLLHCAAYDGRVLDRSAPPGFARHPFIVTFAGRVCPHPDADGFVVDVSRMHRTPEGEAPPAQDSAGEAFVESVRFEAFDGPAVDDILVMDRPERGRRGQNRFWIEDAVLTPDAVWIAHREPGMPPAAKRLSRVDTVSNDVTAELQIGGELAGASGNSLWVFRPGAGADPTMAWRLDEGAIEPTEVPVSCAPGRPAPSSAFNAGTFGVWLGCQTSADAGSASPWRAQRRLDPATGSPLAELTIAPGPMHGDDALVWAEELAAPNAASCRVHAIDPATNRLIRSVSLGSFACEYLTIAGNDAWFVRSNDTLTHVDLTNRRPLHSLKLPKGRTAAGLVIGGERVWLLTTPAADAQEASAKLGSDGGLLRVDRATGTVTGAMIPTGSGNRMIGAAGNTVWLYDIEGAVVRVRDRARYP
jgi:hypothetical protein